MTDQERQQIDQAIEQLRQRAHELGGAKLAPAHKLARAIDQLNAKWVVSYTTRQGAAERARRCR